MSLGPSSVVTWILDLRECTIALSVTTRLCMYKEEEEEEEVMEKLSGIHLTFYCLLRFLTCMKKSLTCSTLEITPHESCSIISGDVEVRPRADCSD